MTSGLHAQVELTRGPLHLDVALEAGAGEVVAVLGPNGAGKTTILRAIAGLEPLDRGHIALDDAVLDDPSAGIFVRPEHRSVGYVFQDHLLFPHLTALDNAAFGLRCRGASRAEARQGARGWLERLGVADVSRHRPGALSGGQSQRVALARALASRPKLLLLDEPLVSLDATTRAIVRAELNTQLGWFEGIRVLVTHDPIDALVLADRLVVVEAGRITQVGPVAEVSRYPRSAYVADLLGINLYRGEAGDGVVRLVDGGQVVVAPRSDPREGPVYVAIRPSAVALHRVRPEGTPRNVWPGPVVGVDAGLDRIRVRVGGPVPIVAEVTPTAVADLGLTHGSQVWAAFKATDVAVYPA